MKKVLITGGAGFIGSQLAIDLSAEGYDVIAIDDLSGGYVDNLFGGQKKFLGRFEQVDIRDAKMDSLFSGVDYVYHFAGVSSLPACQADPYRAFDVNVAGTARVLEISRRAGVKKVIFASTSAVYENSKTFPSAEDQELELPNLVYSLSKWQAEKICRTFKENYNFDSVIFRFFNVYGPHQDYRRKSPPLIGYIIRELLEGNSPILHSDGAQKRDYVFVDDVLALCKSAMTNELANNQVINICSGRGYSVTEIFDCIAAALKISNISPVYRSPSLFWSNYSNLYGSLYPLKDEVLVKEVKKYSLGDPSKSMRTFGFKPTIELEEGIRKIVDYINSHRASQKIESN